MLVSKLLAALFVASLLAVIRQSGSSLARARDETDNAVSFHLDQRHDALMQVVADPRYNAETFSEDWLVFEVEISGRQTHCASPLPFNVSAVSNRCRRFGWKRKLRICVHNRRRPRHERTRRDAHDRTHRTRSIRNDYLHAVFRILRFWGKGGGDHRSFYGPISRRGRRYTSDTSLHGYVWFH